MPHFPSLALIITRSVLQGCPLWVKRQELIPAAALYCGRCHGYNKTPVCLGFPISTRNLMIPVLGNRGSQVPADNSFCVLLHSPYEKCLPEVLSCTRNKVLMARRRGISTILDFFSANPKVPTDRRWSL